jgi:predicted GNAT family N-acyltransferase
MKDGVRFTQTEEELRASYQMRYNVYVEGMGRLKDKGNHELKELKDDYDKIARAVIAIKDGEPIGTLRLFWGGDAPFPQALIEAYHLSRFLDFLDEKKICIVERLMVTEKHRGSTTTLRMYKEVMHFVLDRQVEVVLLDCEPHHLNSYLKLGFRPFAESYSYPGIGLVIPMVLVTGDYEHLKRVGSPFSMLTKEEDFNHCLHTEQVLEKIGHGVNVISQATSNPTDFLKQIYANPKLLENPIPKIFDHLTEDEVQRVIEKSHIIECSLGDHIIDHHNSAKTIFVLLSGAIDVRREGKLIAIVTPGDMIGEIAFFLHMPRSASIIAATDDVRVLSLDEASMSRLLKFESELANKVLVNICRTLCSRVLGGYEASDLRSH